MATCDCAEKLKEMGQKVLAAGVEVSSTTKSEGSYWGTVVGAGFLTSFGKTLVMTACDCVASKRIDDVVGMVFGSEVQKLARKGGGGSFEDRAANNNNFYFLLWFFEKLNKQK